MKTTVEVDCSRCLEGFQVPVESTFDVQYLPTTAAPADPDREVGEQEPDTAFYQDGVIDLRQLVREQIFLMLPMKPLCQESCAGLWLPCAAPISTPAPASARRSGRTPAWRPEGARAEERHRCLIRNAAIPRPGAASVALMTRALQVGSGACARSARKPRRRTACAQPAATTRAGRSAPSMSNSCEIQLASSNRATPASVSGR